MAFYTMIIRVEIKTPEGWKAVGSIALDAGDSIELRVETTIRLSVAGAEPIVTGPTVEEVDTACDRIRRLTENDIQ